MLPLPGVRRTRPTGTRTAKPTSGPATTRRRDVRPTVRITGPPAGAAAGRRLAGEQAGPRPRRPVPPAAGCHARDAATRPTGADRYRPAEARRAGRSGKQLELPFDPYKGNRANRCGQYPLPLDGVRRRHRAQARTTPAATGSACAARWPATTAAAGPAQAVAAAHHASPATDDADLPLTTSTLTITPAGTPVGTVPSSAAGAAAPQSQEVRSMTAPVRIPADVDMHDRVLGPLTARQLAILAAAGAVLYLLWTATRAFVPVPVFLAFAVPVGAASAMLALGKRDGDADGQAARRRDPATGRPTAPRRRTRGRAAGARLAHPGSDHGSSQSRRRKGRQGPATRSPSRSRPRRCGCRPRPSPTTGVGRPGRRRPGGGRGRLDGELRAADTERAGSAGRHFGRYLHSLTAPVQVLVRTERLDLSAQIAELRERAGGLPHPALEAAAVEHADYLVQLGQQSDLLRRQVLLVLREPLGVAAPTDGLGGPGPLAVLSARSARGKRAQARRARPGERRGAAGGGVAAGAPPRRGDRAAVPAGIVVTPLDAGQATAVLASACNPDSLLPPSAGLAGADEVITTSGADLADGRPRRRLATVGARPRHPTPTRQPRPSRHDEDCDDYEDDDYEDERGRS